MKFSYHLVLLSSSITNCLDSHDEIQQGAYGGVRGTQVMNRKGSKGLEVKDAEVVTEKVDAMELG